MAVKSPGPAVFWPWPVRLALARSRSGVPRRRRQAPDNQPSSTTTTPLQNSSTETSLLQITSSETTTLLQTKLVFGSSPKTSSTSGSADLFSSTSGKLDVTSSSVDVAPTATLPAFHRTSSIDINSGDVESDSVTLPFREDEILPSFPSSVSHPPRIVSSGTPSIRSAVDITPTPVILDPSPSSELTARLHSSSDAVDSIANDLKSSSHLQNSSSRSERSATLQHSATASESSQVAPSSVQTSTVVVRSTSTSTSLPLPSATVAPLPPVPIPPDPPAQVTSDAPTPRRTPTTSSKPPLSTTAGPGSGGTLNMSGVGGGKTTAPIILHHTSARPNGTITTVLPLASNPNIGKTNLALAITLPIAIFLVLIIILVAGIALWRWKHIKKKTTERDGDLWIEHTSYELSPSLQRQRDLADTHSYVADDSVSVNVSPREDVQLYLAVYEFEAEDDGQLPLVEGETVVEVVEKLDTGWWRGMVEDQEGWFPASFVEPYYDYAEDPGLTNPGFEGDSYIASERETIYDQPMIHPGADKMVPAEVPVVPDIASHVTSAPGGPEDSLDPFQTTDEMSTDQQQERWKVALKEVLLRIKKDPQYWAKLMNRSGGDGQDGHSSDGESIEDSDSEQDASHEDADSVSDFDDDNDGDLTGIEYRALYAFQPQQDGDLEFDEGDTIVVFEILDNGWWRGCCKEREGWLPGNYVQVIPQSPTLEDSGFTSIQKKEGPSLSGTVPPHSPSAASSGFGAGGDTANNPSTSSPSHSHANDGSSLTSSVFSPPLGAPQFSPLSASSPAQQDSSMTWKPEVPRRYITPKLRVVRVPKKSLHRWAGHKPKKRPAPPPPSHPPSQTTPASPGCMSVASTSNGAPGGLAISTSSLNRSNPSLVSGHSRTTLQSGTLPCSPVGSQTSLNRSQQNTRQRRARTRPTRPRAPPPPRPKRPPPPVPTHKERSSPGRSLNSLPRESPGFRGQVSPAVSDNSLERPGTHLGYMSTPVLLSRGMWGGSGDMEMNHLHRQTPPGYRAQREQSPYATTALFAVDEKRTPSTEPLTVAWDGTPVNQMERVSPLGAEDSGTGKYSVVPSEQFQSHSQSPLMTSSPRDDVHHDKDRPVVAVKPNLKGTHFNPLSPIPNDVTKKGSPASPGLGSPSVYVPDEHAEPDYATPPAADESDIEEEVDMPAIPPPSEFSDYQAESSQNDAAQSEMEVTRGDIADELRNALNRRKGGARPSQLRKSLSVDSPYSNNQELQLTVASPAGAALSRSAGSAAQLYHTGDAETDASYTINGYDAGSPAGSDLREDYVIRSPSALSSGCEADQLSPRAQADRPKPTRKAPKPPTPEANVPSTPFYSPQSEGRASSPEEPAGPKPPPPPRLVPSPFKKQAPGIMKQDPDEPRKLSRPQRPSKPPRRCLSHDPSQMNGHDLRLGLDTPQEESKSTPASPTDQCNATPSRPPPPSLSTSRLPNTRPQFQRTRSHTDSIISLDNMPGSKKKTTLRRAWQNYSAQREGELSFTADSFIKEIGQAPGRPGWMVGMLSDGTVGYYPHSHVKDIYADLMQSQV